jgi:hypothetical protein
MFRLHATSNKQQATWQPHKPHKTIQLIKKHEKNNQSTWVPHVFTLIRKEKLTLQKQQLPWRRLYRGGKPPEDGCMKPKHVV